MSGLSLGERLLFDAGIPSSVPYIREMRNPFRRKRKTPRTYRNERISAVGDIHARYDLLRALLNNIRHYWHNSANPVEKFHLVFLGDVIDRGPDSARCLQEVQELVAQPGFVCLRGNHEDLLLRSINGEGAAQQIWLANGGDVTIASFSVEPPRADEDSFDFGDRLREAIPEPLVTMLERTRNNFANSDYFFVHAGVKPRPC